MIRLRLGLPVWKPCFLQYLGGAKPEEPSGPVDSNRLGSLQVFVHLDGIGRIKFPKT